MEEYESSLDWGHELVPSLLWILKYWAGAAVITVFALFLLGRFTVWGRQYWRITGAYFRGRDSVRIWIWLAALLLSVIILVRINVLLSYFGNDLYTALQVAFEATSAGEKRIRDDAISGFWTALGIFVILATIYISMVMLDIYITQRFIIRWRTWLTYRLTGAWLDDHAYYRGRFTDAQTDNPDQRIQQDIDIFTTGVGGTPNSPTTGTGSMLLFGAISSVATVLAFIPILWRLSFDLTIFGVTHAQGAVLGGVRVRVPRDGGGVLDRAPADPAELPKRGHQRRVPVRTGASARRRRGGGVLPRREDRARNSAYPV